MMDKTSNQDLLRSLLLMASVVEARDPYTGGHLWRVSQFSHLLTKQLNLSEDEQFRIKVGAYLHDLGKVAVSDSVLQKAGELSTNEYNEIKIHSVVGYNIIEKHPLGGPIKHIIRHHHERLDGDGYPDGLIKAELNIGEKIVSICDAFDAMTSTRPYRKYLSIEEAFSRLNQEKGSQFDGELVSVFEELVYSGQLRHIVLHSDTHQPLLSCIRCGPTITVSQDCIANSTTTCRTCGGKYNLFKENGEFAAEFTGYFATRQELAPRPDIHGVEQFISRLPEVSEFLASMAG